MTRNERAEWHARMQAGVALVAVVALIIVVIGFVRFGNRLNEDQTRTCEVLNTKIRSEIRLQAIRNAATRSTDIARRNDAAATARLLRAVGRAPRRPDTVAVVGLLKTTIALDDAEVRAGRTTLVAGEEFIVTWRKLATKLHC